VLNALGNIGDFLGGIGVVITLIYLAFQIRQNTAQLRADAEQRRLSSLDEMTRGLADWQSDIVTSAEVTDLCVRDTKGDDKLGGAERLRFEYQGARILQMWQANYFRYLHTGDSDNWGTDALHVRMFLGWPGFRAYWDNTKHLYNDRFQQRVERLASAPPAV